MYVTRKITDVSHCLILSLFDGPPNYRWAFSCQQFQTEPLPEVSTDSGRRQGKVLRAAQADIPFDCGLKQRKLQPEPAGEILSGVEGSVLPKRSDNSHASYERAAARCNRGGETGIRTQVRVSPKHAFQACAFSHSAISPIELVYCSSLPSSKPACSVSPPLLVHPAASAISPIS